MAHPRSEPPTDETRPDHEALVNAISDPWNVPCHRCGAAPYTACSTVIDGTDAHMDRRADAVLALLPAPHPQGGTEALRARIEALCDKADRSYQRSGWPLGQVGTAQVRALLAAAPAPTEGQ